MFILKTYLKFIPPESIGGGCSSMCAIAFNATATSYAQLILDAPICSTSFSNVSDRCKSGLRFVCISMLCASAANRSTKSSRRTRRNQDLCYDYETRFTFQINLGQAKLLILGNNSRQFTWITFCCFQRFQQLDFVQFLRQAHSMFKFECTKCELL